MHRLVFAAVFLIAAQSPMTAAADDAPPPPADMHRLLDELRRLDSSMDRKGDHAVGEQLCRASAAEA
ncbi:MAG: hypothetical protein COW30_15290 [Rhodospirillales bacterium CG15_BIG_FIL_POST_REV_8_21_14_020_66_15]|nr:MAG: hypothetical protein COW30_15290 [Rhodospirillales bacterium CG15_BIG_FIL_POST_REV_8_21_14_020_66_15]